MTSSDALTKSRTTPLYFFDQPRKRNRIRGTRGSLLYFNAADEGVQIDAIQSSDNKEGIRDELTQRLTGETCGDHGKPDTSARNIKDPLHAYKRAAPQLLNELARLLSQHKWTEKGCIPHGFVNILNYSWRDLAAGAVQVKSADNADIRRKCKSSVKLDEARARQVSTNDKRDNVAACGVENVGPSVRKLQFSSHHPRVKKRKHIPKAAPCSPAVSFSISSNSGKDPQLSPGWIVQPKQPACDEPQQIRVCQWVLERLQAAKSPGKLQPGKQELNKPLILRHYGDTRSKVKDKRVKRKTQPVTLVNGMPHIPEIKQQDPARQKLHYRISDGTSFIYYKSGCMAVCQSHSGLPGGGFYTNVFSDSDYPVILATMTAFGRAAVTHPISSTITALWDQDGGFMCDLHGKITKEWSWQTDRNTLREQIVVQLSDLISVKLLSGTSAMLTFRCNSETVQLPLSALSNANQSKGTLCLQTEGNFISDVAQDLLPARRAKSPVVVLERKRSLTLTPEVLQMVREVEGLEEPAAQWRRGGGDGCRELKRLQLRVRIALDDWLDYYRVAIGIKCPGVERVPDAPLRTRLRREVQSTALPSINPPEQAHDEPIQTEEPVRPEEKGRKELQDLHGHLPTPGESSLDSDVKLPRCTYSTPQHILTPKKRPKEENHFTQIGPLQIHGNIKLESVTITNSQDFLPNGVARRPTPQSFTPSVPLTVCPALLRAALMGEGGRRRCCCSAALMPVLTDLELDAFIMGQPPHSQQILVVCVCTPRQPANTHAVPEQDVLEQLHRRRNKHRTMPCNQCQLDSFRLVRYEMSKESPSCVEENVLLQQRHNAAPGMVLMYIRGKLLFVGYTFSGHNGGSVRDLQKQICRARGDYRLGVSLPSDYKFSDTVNEPTATETHCSQDATLKGHDVTAIASVEKEKASERKNKVSNRRQMDFSIKPKKTAAFPHVSVVTH